MPSLRIIGPGRAGTALAGALGAAGWDVRPMLGRGDGVAAAARGVDLLVVATPDRVIAEVAGAVEPGDAVVAHLAGSLGLDVLAPHVRRAAVHPLVSIPPAPEGAARLTSGAWFAVAGDPLGRRVVEALGGRSFEIDDSDRAAYHTAACIASNHLVALLGQVERVVAPLGVPFDAYLDLVRGTLDNVAALGPQAALTGPAAHGDRATIARHLAALDPAEWPAYAAMADQARRLAGLPAEAAPTGVAPPAAVDDGRSPDAAPSPSAEQC